MPGYLRAQNRPSLFDKDKMANMYHVTEKLDGDTMIVYHLSKDSPWNHSLPTTEAVHWVDDGRIGVCNRRADIAENSQSIFWGPLASRTYWIRFKRWASRMSPSWVSSAEAPS